jgi:type IV pilus assembly protein PilB
VIFPSLQPESSKETHSTTNLSVEGSSDALSMEKLQTPQITTINTDPRAGLPPLNVPNPTELGQSDFENASAALQAGFLVGPKPSPYFVQQLPVSVGWEASLKKNSLDAASVDERVSSAPVSPVQANLPVKPESPASSGLPTLTIPKPKPKRIGDILIEEGYITPQQLEQALQEGKATNSPLGAVLNKLGYIDEITLGKALAKLHGLQYIDTSTIDIDPEVMKLIPVDFIKRHMVVPYRMDKAHKRIEVIMARPDNLHILDEVALLTGYRPIPRVSTHKELVALLDKFYRNRATADDAMARLEEDFSKHGNNYDQGGIANELEAEMAADDAPVVQLVNSILIDALDSNASDIHVEPQKERLLVRFRIDGILREVRSIPKKMGAAFVSRIKVASGMDIAERRRPQDGRMRLKEGSQEVDMRVNSLATQFGEKIVIRLLRANATTGGIEKLGLSSYEAKRIEKMIHSPHGIILVTGPTGSGKTTTLYSCLREINSPERNITTIEDPVEYPLPGVNQTQVSQKSGLTFSLCLRAILRQDPDVVMVGEIRDHETLEAAIHASLTGHLVFSTLHTNSAAKTITRLLEMGAPAYLVSTAVIGILAQRLVRRTCTHCKTSYTSTEEEMVTLGITNPVTLTKGEGCEKCSKTGYSGRVGLYEIMNMNREVQELVGSGASTFQIQDAAIRNGMFTLGMDGKRKIFDGMTTVAEVTRVLGLDLEEK